MYLSDKKQWNVGFEKSRVSGELRNMDYEKQGKFCSMFRLYPLHCKCNLSDTYKILM